MSQLNNINDDMTSDNDTTPSSPCPSICSTISASTVATPPPTDQDMRDIVIPDPMIEIEAQLRSIKRQLDWIQQRMTYENARIHRLVHGGHQYRTKRQLCSIEREINHIAREVDRQQVRIRSLLQRARAIVIEREQLEQQQALLANLW